MWRLRSLVRNGSRKKPAIEMVLDGWWCGWVGWWRFQKGRTKPGTPLIEWLEAWLPPPGPPEKELLNDMLMPPMFIELLIAPLNPPGPPLNELLNALLAPGPAKAELNALLCPIGPALKAAALAPLIPP